MSEILFVGETLPRKRAIIDEFTGAYNRRYYDEVVNEQFQDAKDHNLPFSIVMVDLDRFREINNAYGREIGDQVIKEAAKVFQKNLRNTDILIRFGGDEFIFLMPATDAKAAFEVSENIRLKVGDLELLRKLKGPVSQISTSQGIASYPENGEDLKALREMADQAVYQAKEQGRNKVVCFQS